MVMKFKSAIPRYIPILLPRIVVLARRTENIASPNPLATLTGPADDFVGRLGDQGWPDYQLRVFR